MKQYIVDAFTDKIFHGNPAAICVMNEWISDDLMKSIAKENNLSETAFIVKEDEGYYLRWFTPKEEIDLCGHATLASAFVLFNFYLKDASEIVFKTMSGNLIVGRNKDLFVMEFPKYTLEKVEVSKDIIDALGVVPLEVYKGRDLLCVLKSEDEVKNIKLNSEKLLTLDGLMVHVTARGKNFDCVSRSFGPKIGIKEDPVCGSAHCHIIPYWTEKLKKEKIVAYQASSRGGTLYCRMSNGKVYISGKAVLYSKADLSLKV